jgi:hypothetical protein
MHAKRDAVWIGAFAILTLLGVPWFLWGEESIVAGLPIWLWWHIFWMALASVVFYLFTRESWDRMMGVDGGSDPVRQPTEMERNEE